MVHPTGHTCFEPISACLWLGNSTAHLAGHGESLDYACCKTSHYPFKVHGMHCQFFSSLSLERLLIIMNVCVAIQGLSQRCMLTNLEWKYWMVVQLKRYQLNMFYEMKPTCFHLQHSSRENVARDPSLWSRIKYTFHHHDLCNNLWPWMVSWQDLICMGTSVYS